MSKDERIDEVLELVRNVKTTYEVLADRAEAKGNRKLAKAYRKKARRS